MDEVMIFAELRKKTSLHHERLEKRLDLFNRIQTTNDYIELLQKFYSFYQGIEPKLATQLQGSFIDFEERRKLSLLEQDLQFFHVSFQTKMSNSEKNGKSLSLLLPEIKTLGQALGCLYVLEGSTLGGQIISRHFSCKLNLNPEQGLAFFTGYGKNTAQMWKDFQSSTRAYLDPFSSLPAFATLSKEIIETACETFQILESWLCTGLKRATK